MLHIENNKPKMLSPSSIQLSWLKRVFKALLASYIEINSGKDPIQTYHVLSLVKKKEKKETAFHFKLFQGNLIHILS